MLLPQQLKGLWRDVDDGRLTTEQAMAEQARLLGERKKTWASALLDPTATSLADGLLTELGEYLGVDDRALMRERCSRSLDQLRGEWVSNVRPEDRESVERYYRNAEGTLYELTSWHTLADDESPLAYVNALELALERGCRRALDFGSGVGSGGLLFARAGFDVTLADISVPLLDFARWRFAHRRLRASFIDLANAPLPQSTFDVVTAMDVFEHLADPVGTLDVLARALRPGGLIIGRFSAEADADRPQHIVLDFTPVFRRLDDLGFAQVWEDDWLWGHRAYEKPHSSPGNGESR